MDSAELQLFQQRPSLPFSCKDFGVTMDVFYEDPQFLEQLAKDWKADPEYAQYLAFFRWESQGAIFPVLPIQRADRPISPVLQPAPQPVDQLPVNHQSALQSVNHLPVNNLPALQPVNLPGQRCCYK